MRSLGFAAACLVMLTASMAVARGNSAVNPEVRSALRSSIPASVGAPAQASPDDAPSADTGFLTVTAEPAAKLEVDGKDTGLTTPVTKLALKAGKHKVTLTSLDGKTKRTLGVTITAGEEKRLQVSLN